MSVDLDEEVNAAEMSRCFVPEILVDYLKQQSEKNALEPGSFFLQGVCLLVDISGFTKLSGEYCEQGKSGIDGLQLATNGYMGQLVETIYAHGGDIIKFAGDAIICIFPATLTMKIVKVSRGRSIRRSMLAVALNRSSTDTDDAKMSDEVGNLAQSVSFAHHSISSRHTSLDMEAETESSGKATVRPELILRAMHCADELRKIEMEQLTVHVAMTCGEMCFGILGGYEHRWECLISGPCLQELSSCLDDAPSKQAVISADCFEVLWSGLHPSFGVLDPPTISEKKTRPKLTSCYLAGYTFSLDPLASCNHIIESVRQGAEDRSFSATTIETEQVNFRKNRTMSSLYEVRSWNQDPIISSYILQFVPVHIVEGLSAGSGLKYIAEIREVTTMFMKVSAA